MRKNHRNLEIYRVVKRERAVCEHFAVECGDFYFHSEMSYIVSVKYRSVLNSLTAINPHASEYRRL